MQLRQPQPLRVLDDHQRGVGHVDADFDDGGGHQQVGLAFLEAAHRGLLVGGFHASVDEGHAQLGQRRGQGFVGGLRGLRHDLVAVVDQRADPVGLPPFGAGGADALHQLWPALRAQSHGLHRRTARRQFVDGRHVQIGIGRHRQRARDRRGRHDQLVRHAVHARALVAQRQPLVHPEAVLLIDDGQAQIVEDHRLLHQRMRAHHHLRLARGHLGQHLRARLAGHLAGQPGDANAQRLQPCPEIGQVLFGQQLGGRGQGDLLAGFHGQHAGQRRDHGLAAAHIALHQAQHRRRARDVLADLFEDALLRTGQRERQGLDQRFHQRAPPLQRRRPVLLQGQPLAPQAQVVREQLFDRQPALRRMRPQRQRGHVRIARRTMHGQQRVAQRRQSEAFEQRRGQQLQRARFRQALECLPDQFAQRRRAQPFDGRVDRVQRIAQRDVVRFAQHPVAGVDDLQPVLAGLGCAVAAKAGAHRELRHLRRAEMEEPQHQRAMPFVAYRHPQHRAIAEAALDGFHPPFDLRGHARLQQPDRRERRAILVPQRQVQPQVLHRHQAARRQFLRHARPDARQAAQGFGGEIDDGDVATHGHRTSMP